MPALISVGDAVRRRPSSHAIVLPSHVLRVLVFRAIKVALVVGSCLTLINQGDALFGATPAPALWWKVPLTYCVPFVVSLYSALSAMRTAGQSSQTQS
jgi:methyl-accepting chemotaxis protein